MAESKNQTDIPVKFFIRVTKKDGEAGERAMLIAEDERGKQYTFMYEDIHGDPWDLTVYDMPEKVRENDGHIC